MIFAARFLFFFMKVAKLLRIKKSHKFKHSGFKTFSISVKFCRYSVSVMHRERKKRKKKKKGLSRDFPFLLAEACDFDL